MILFRKRKKREQEQAAKIAELENQILTIKNEMSPAEEKFMKDFMVGGWVGGGVSVNGDSAMKCSAVFACVRLLSGAIASAPVKIYRRGEKRARVEVENHPFKRMLGLKPNDNITASTFWKTLAGNKVLHGNGFAVIVRSTSGRPIALYPIRPARVTVYQAWELNLHLKLNVDKNRLYYSVTWDDGTINIIDQDDMIHVPNIGWDGKQGLSTIRAGAQAIGLAISSEESASKLFEHGMLNNLALTYPAKLNQEAQERLRKHLADRHGGSANHYNPLILTEGGDVKTMNMNPDDAQLIESRNFSVIDIARFFGVPPVMIGENEKTSSFGGGVEQMARWFVMFTLNDHFTDIEQELEVKLFRNSDCFAEFDETELTRGDTKTITEYNKAAIGSMQQPGWLTKNEIRSNIGMGPIEGGDELFTPDPSTQQPAKGGANDAQK